MDFETFKKTVLAILANGELEAKTLIHDCNRSGGAISARTATEHATSVLAQSAAIAGVLAEHEQYRAEPTNSTPKPKPPEPAPERSERSSIRGTS